MIPFAVLLNVFEYQINFSVSHVEYMLRRILRNPTNLVPMLSFEGTFSTQKERNHILWAPERLAHFLLSRVVRQIHLVCFNHIALRQSLCHCTVNIIPCYTSACSQIITILPISNVLTAQDSSQDF